MSVRGSYLILWLLLVPSLAFGHDLLRQLEALSPPSPHGCSQLLSETFVETADGKIEELAKIDETTWQKILPPAKAHFVRASLLARKEGQLAVKEVLASMRANRKNIDRLPQEAHSIILQGENTLLLWAVKKLPLSSKSLRELCLEIERAKYTYTARSPILRKDRSNLLQDFLFLSLVARMAANEKSEQPFLDIYETLQILSAHPKLSERERAVSKLALGHFTLNFGQKNLKSIEIKTRGPIEKQITKLTEKGNDLAAGISLSLKSFRSLPPIEIPQGREKWENNIKELISTSRKAYWLLFLEELTQSPRPDFLQRRTRLCCDMLRLRQLIQKEKEIDDISFGPALDDYSLCMNGLTTLAAMAHDLSEPEREKYFLKACLDWFDCPYTHGMLHVNRWKKVEKTISPTSGVGLMVLSAHRQIVGNRKEFLELSTLAFEKLVEELQREKDKGRRRMLVFALTRLCRHRWPLLSHRNDFATLIPETSWVDEFTSKVVKDFDQLAPLDHRTLWTLAQLCRLDYLIYRKIQRGREKLEKNLRQVLTFPDMVILRHHCKMVLAGKRLKLH